MSDVFHSVEWDEEKSQRNDMVRGFDLAYAAQLFRGAYVEEESRTRGFGERRFVAIGVVDGLILTVVWTPRNTARRIISARRASRKERRYYYVHRSEETLRTRSGPDR